VYLLVAETSAKTIKDFTIEGLRRRCAPKHRNSRRETAGWDRVGRQEVFVLCWKAGPSPNDGSAKARAGSMNTPGPFNFHKSRTSLCGRVSKTQPAWGSTRATCQWGRGRQAMHLPCKQVDVGALPTDSTNFNCGENEIQVSLISFASVGATPTPATIHGK